MSTNSCALETMLPEGFNVGRDRLKLTKLLIFFTNYNRLGQIKGLTEDKYPDYCSLLVQQHLDLLDCRWCCHDSYCCSNRFSVIEKYKRWWKEKYKGSFSKSLFYCDKVLVSQIIISTKVIILHKAEDKR